MLPLMECASTTRSTPTPRIEPLAELTLRSPPISFKRMAPLADSTVNGPFKPLIVIEPLADRMSAPRAAGISTT